MNKQSFKEGITCVVIQIDVCTHTNTNSVFDISPPINIDYSLMHTKKKVNPNIIKCKKTKVHYHGKMIVSLIRTILIVDNQNLTSSTADELKM